MLYHFKFTITHDCPFSVFSRKHKEVLLSLWCNNSYRDILELQGEETALQNAISTIETDLGEIISKELKRGHVQLVMKRCECDTYPLSAIYDRHDCVELPPVIFYAGRETVNLLVTAEGAGLILESIRKENPQAHVEVLELIPLKSVHKPNPIFLPLNNLKEHLTAKQTTAITMAYNNGHYESPRSTKVEELALEMGIHKRTYAEHLRKAEKKIMSFLIPSLNLKTNLES